MGANGTLFVGTVDGTGTGGALFALNPLDGSTTASTTALGGIVSLATASSGGNDLVYFSSNDATGGAVGACSPSQVGMCTNASTAGGARLAARGNGTTTTTSTSSALALVVKSATETGAVAAFNSAGATAGSTVVYSPASTPAGVNASPTNAFDFALVPDHVSTANNIIVNGSTAFLLTRPGGVGLFRRTITSVNTTPVDGAAVTIAASGNALTMGQSLVGNEGLVGGMNTIFSFFRLNPGIVDSSNLGVGVDNGLAVFDGTLAFVGRGDALVSFNPNNLAATPSTLASVSGNVRTSPVLGNARPGGSPLGYAVSGGTTSPSLYVFPLSGTASAVDFGTIFSSTGTVYAHPTLDCNRRAAAATSTTGVLYVANGQGRVAAVIVDSPKLLTVSGAWPKYQRTAGNAGNTDTRFELNPGCPSN